MSVSSRAPEKVLAVGAAGAFAGLVVPELASRGARVRGFVRDDSQADHVRDLGAVEIARGDLRDKSSVAAALVGIDSVFYVAPAFLQDEASVGRAMVDAAKAAGVRRFVFSSVIHPIILKLENHIAKAPVEEAVLESGMEFTFLHPALFFQNYAASWKQIVASGVVAEPWSIASRFSRVDYREVAEVAAVALTEDRLLNGTFELCAEGWLDRADVAADIGAALNRTIRAQRVDPAVAAASAGDQGAGLKPMFDWYDKRGLKGSAVTLRAILGREPKSLREYFMELAESPERVRPYSAGNEALA